MVNLLRKECKLSASILSYLFIVFSLMVFIPNYPILCGVFFVTLGLFQSYQNVRDTNDIVFSALLPIPKKDVVKAKFIFCTFIELISVILMFIFTIIRSTVLKNATAYVQNKLMNPNLFFIAIALLIFSLFNLIFVAGFFKTAYKYGMPFVIYIIVCFLVIFVAEALHFFPSLAFLNANMFDDPIPQIICLIMGIILSTIITLIGYKVAKKRFDSIDL